MRRGLGFHNRRSPGGFSPLSLFAGGINGAWYDPSDATTLFSDRAGTTPCATPGAGAVVPVGAMLDKRASGYSVFFDGTGDFLSTTTAAMISGSGDFTIEGWIYPTVVSGQDNVLYETRANPSTGGWVFFLTNTGALRFYDGIPPSDFLATGSTSAVTLNAWQHIALVKSGDTFTYYINGSAAGTNTRSSLTVGSTVRIGTRNDTTNSYRGYISNFRVVAGTAVYTTDFTPPTSPLSPISGTSLLTCGTSWSGNPAITKNGDARVDGLNPFLASPVGNHAIAANDTTARPELSARVNLLNATATLATQSVTTAATNYTLHFTGAGSIALSGTASGTYNAGTHTITCTAGTLTLTITGTVTTADLRPANIGVNLPVYQAVVSTYSYDSAGFPRRLVFNGTSSAMSTPANLNLSGTDKVTVFAGVRKNTDSTAVVAELGTIIDTTNGSFAIAVNGGANWFSGLRGTSYCYYNSATYTAPISNIIATSYDIAGAAIADEIKPRINATLNQTGAAGAANAGTGNFGTYPLFIGARNNASFFLNGDIYSLIVVGSAVSAGNITATETWVNGKTGGVY